MNSDFKIIIIQMDKIVLQFIKYINYRVGGYTYLATPDIRLKVEPISDLTSYMILINYLVRIGMWGG